MPAISFLTDKIQLARVSDRSGTPQPALAFARGGEEYSVERGPERRHVWVEGQRQKGYGYWPLLAMAMACETELTQSF